MDRVRRARSAKLLAVFFAVVGAAALGLLATVSSVVACSCASLPSPLSALMQADAVFVGEIVVNTGEMLAGRATTLDRQFRVIPTRVWRGAVWGDVPIYSARSSAECGYPFEPGVEYLVYAQYSPSNPSQLWTTICHRTRPIGDAVEDLMVLEQFHFRDSVEGRVIPMAAQLEERLVSSEPEDRVLAADGLREFLADSGAAVQMLRQAYQRDEAPIPTVVERERILLAISGHGEAARGEADWIAGELDEPAPEIRAAALRALVFADPTSDATRDAFLAATADPDTRVRLEALRLVGEYGALHPSCCVDRMVELTRDLEREIRKASLDGLIQLKEIDGVLAADLEPLLSDPAPEVRMLAIRCVGRLAKGATGANEMLARLLESNDVETRRVAVLALADRCLIGEDVTDILGVACTDGSVEVAKTALRLVLRCVDAGDARCRAMLRSFAHENQTLRRIAAETLANEIDCGELVVESLIALLRDPYPRVRGTAVTTLATYDPVSENVRPAMIRTLRDLDVRVCEMAVRALAMIDPLPVEARPDLERLSVSSNDRLAGAARSLLLQIDSRAK